MQATVEISSRYDGVISKVHWEVGDMVPTGAALVDIDVEVDDGAAEEAAPAVEAAPAAASSSPAAAGGRPSKEVR